MSAMQPLPEPDPEPSTEPRLLERYVLDRSDLDRPPLTFQLGHPLEQMLREYLVPSNSQAYLVEFDKDGNKRVMILPISALPPGSECPTCHGMGVI